MSDYQARPTIYRGTRMRSRLEAAWAEQFDALGWAWQYEPVCLATRSGQYLPDFQVKAPGVGPNLWIEIKGGYWEDPDARGVGPADNDDRWADLYEIVFGEITRMTTAVFENDPTGVFVLLYANGGASDARLWWPGLHHHWNSWQVFIGSCGSGCVSFVGASGSTCLKHGGTFSPIDLIPSLYLSSQIVPRSVDEVHARLTIPGSP